MLKNYGMMTTITDRRKEMTQHHELVIPPITLKSVLKSANQTIQHTMQEHAQHGTPIGIVQLAARDMATIMTPHAHNANRAGTNTRTISAIR